MMSTNRNKLFLLRHAIAFACAASILPGAAVAEGTITVTADTPELNGGKVISQVNAGLLGIKDTRNTPFSVSGYGSEFIGDRQAKNLGEIIQHDASVRLTSPAGGILDSLMIRGFPVGEGNIGEVALNGVYGIAPNYQPLAWYIQRVEVLKGPSAGLYGMSPNGGVGGVVNVVTKRATAQNITSLTTTWESDSQFGQYADIGRLWTNSDGEMWKVRFNGGGSAGNLPQDNSRKNSAFASLALDYAKDRFRVSLDVLDQDQHVKSPVRPFIVSPGVDVPPAPDGKKNIAQQGMWWKIRDQGTLLHTEYDINDNLTFFANAGGSRSLVSRLSEQTPNIYNEQGDAVSTLTNYRFNVHRYTLETGLKSIFSTGTIEHQLTLQASYYHDRLAVGGSSGQKVYSSIYFPTAQDIVKPSAPLRTPKTSSSQLTSLALADTLSLADGHVDVIPGLRFQKVRSDNFASDGSRSAAYDESAFTPMLGLVWHPWQPVFMYANYIEGLSKGDIAPATAENAGQVMRPYRSRQYELGIKYDEHGLLTSLSLFQITRPGGATDSKNIYSTNSEQRNRGIEFSISGKPAQDVNMQGSLSLTDARITRAPASAVKGNKPVGVSPVQANLGIEYALPVLKGLSVNSQISYSGKQYVNQLNTQSIGSWITVDMGAAYKTPVYGTTATFRFNVNNVFNRRYWAGVASYSTIAHGAPRTFLASVTVDF